MPAAAVPQLLTKVFLCITFHWDVWNLSYLQHVTEELARWPTQLDVRVVSNKHVRLNETFHSWGLPDTIQVVAAPSNLSHPYELAWIHRDLMRDAYETGEYTAFIYLEDDMRLTWKCITSWAIDQEVLDPMNFQRQFFRTEIAPWNGKEQLSDALQHVYLPTYGRTLDIGKQKKAHQHYIQLPDPYSAVFAATSKLMARFMQSQYWTQRIGAWPSREMAANGIMFVDPPERFWVAAVVPFFPDKQLLSHEAAIQHLSNRYCGKRAHKQGFHDQAPPIETTGFCVMDFEDFFTQDNTTKNGPPHIDMDNVQVDTTQLIEPNRRSLSEDMLPGQSR
ncbi:hypothetical protein WJX74_004902 [Apatococcus lobatus]|uniref:Uncharacterized protein n=1 Tax=Apatococcus lobatus TaxID=904363 RepID=A0AAW1QC14_9CHLO